jgi:hypothetical protein
METSIGRGFMTKSLLGRDGRYSGCPVVYKSLTQVGFRLAQMGSLIVFILAALPTEAAIALTLLVMLGLTALAVRRMGLLARSDGSRVGHTAEPLIVEIVPRLVLIASSEPAFRSMTGRRAAAPSRAPPSRSHLVGLALPAVLRLAALPGWFDLEALGGALRSAVAPSIGR